MRGGKTRRVGLAALTLASFLALGTTAPRPAEHEPRHFLRADSERLVLPPVGRHDLRSAAAAPDGGSQHSSISVDVVPPQGDRGWELTVRTEPMTGRGAALGPPRVYWKLASESPSDFRPLGDDEQLVKRSAHPTHEKITIDVVFAVGWNVAPGSYDVEFLFSLEPV